MRRMTTALFLFAFAPLALAQDATKSMKIETNKAGHPGYLYST